MIGGAGFQLINVNNVSLRLGGWQTDTQLLSRKALAATLARHYRDEVIKEAHKVCLHSLSSVPVPSPAVCALQCLIHIQIHVHFTTWKTTWS